MWDYGVANIAPSSTVTASSRSNLAGTVVDGNNTGKGWDDWVSGGNFPKSSWLAFSWTSAQTAQEVAVHTFRDGGATWPSTVGVQYKDAAGAWVDTEVSATLDQSSEEAPSVSLDVSSLPATTGIRLQLQTETNTWQAISEVQILGTPQAQGNVCTLPGSTTAASFYQTEWQTLPSKNACDGNTSTAWLTWRGSGEYPDTESFTLTPGTAYDVSAVTFTNTEGSPQSVHVTYRGTDGLWHDAAEPTAVASNGTQTKVEFAPVTATAVRLTFATTGTFLKIPEIAVAGTLATDPAAGPSIESSAATRCVAGKAYVASSVKNTGTGSVAVEVTSAYGEKSFATVQPGATVSVAQNSRQSAIAAGTVTVTATAGGVTTQSAPYAATTCG